MKEFVDEFASWDARARHLLEAAHVTIGRDGWGDISFEPEPAHGTREHAAMQLVSTLHLMRVHTSGTDRTFLHLTITLGAALQRLNWMADAMEGQRVVRKRKEARKAGAAASKKRGTANERRVARLADEIRVDSPRISETDLIDVIRRRQKDSKITVLGRKTIKNHLINSGKV